MPEHNSTAQAEGSAELEPDSAALVSFEPSVDASREAAFQRHLETTVNYNRKIRDDGDIPWFEDPDKLAKLETRLPGISQTPGEPARRRFFMEKYSRG